MSVESIRAVRWGADKPSDFDSVAAGLICLRRSVHDIRAAATGAAATPISVYEKDLWHLTDGVAAGPVPAVACADDQPSPRHTRPLCDAGRQGRSGRLERGENGSGLGQGFGDARMQLLRLGNPSRAFGRRRAALGRWR